jgi:hypothetical protein
LITIKIINHYQGIEGITTDRMLTNIQYIGIFGINVLRIYYFNEKSDFFNNKSIAFGVKQGNEDLIHFSANPIDQNIRKVSP